MRKLIILCAVLFTKSAVGQNISITQLIALTQSSIENSESVLMAKGYDYWKVDSADGCANYWFAYQKDARTDRASTFVSLGFCLAKPHIVFYQFLDRAAYQKYRNDVKTLGYKLVKSEPDQFGNLEHYYSNSARSSRTIKLSVGEDDGTPFYLVIVLESSNL